MHSEEHEIIELIYQTALDPALWPITLDGLAAILNNVEAKDIINNPLLFSANNRNLFPAVNQSGLTETDGVLQCEPIGNNDLTQHDFFNIIKPHLVRALKIRLNQYHLESKIAVFSGLLDRLPMGVLLLDDKGEILFENTMAETILGDAEYIGKHRNILHFKDSEHSQILKKYLQQIDTGTPNQAVETIQIPNSNGGYYSLLLSEMTLTDMPAIPYRSIMAFIAPSLQQKELSAQILKQVYRLTRSEISLANALVQGKSPEHIAAERHVSINTIRSQLRSLFEKTGTKRQTELVCRLLTSPAAMTAPGKQSGNKTAKSFRAGGSNTHPGKTFRLNDGRLMGYQIYGDSNGIPLVFCHSCYGCRLETPYNLQYLLDRGIRFIVPDRPSIGLSDPFVYNHYSDWAHDLAQLLDHLSIDDFIIAGKNTGGNFALAAAHGLGARIRHVTVASPAPPVTTLADAKDFMSAHKFQICLALTVPSIAIQLYSIIFKAAAVNPQRFMLDILAVDEAEREIMSSPYFQEFARKCYPELAKRGVHGMAGEIRYLVKPWNFDLVGITQPVTFWRGQLDKGTLGTLLT